MSLANSIANYEMQQARNLMVELASVTGVHNRRDVNQTINYFSSVTGSIAECIIKGMHALGEENDEQIRTIVTKVNLITTQSYERVGRGNQVRHIADPRYINGMMSVVTETIKIYERILNQESNTDRIDEAIRNEFGTLEAYQEAQKPRRKAVRTLGLETTKICDYGTEALERGQVIENKLNNQADSKLFEKSNIVLLCE